ncbi:MAG: N-acetylmuramic acid 6-phosphate etherase, partial [Lachnospiraceae bacterium]|nr:N-acetylmuramic acid 6-phosphate etherase [Lachnospiraceae bacterium]
MVKLDYIATEESNEVSFNIDTLAVEDMVRLMNDEDKKVAEAVSKVIPQIAEASGIIYQQLKKGGRLIYIGCGTSGRLGVLDAVECPPTFGTDPEMVQAIIAGGENA